MNTIGINVKAFVILQFVLIVLLANNCPVFGYQIFFQMEKIDTNYESDSFIIPDSVTAETVIRNYIESIGGEDSIRNVIDRTTVMRGTIQGQNITFVTYQKAPNKLKQDIKFGTFNQLLIFDGMKGVMKTSENEIEIEGDDLEKLRIEATLDFILHPNDYGAVVTLIGMKKIDAQNCYEIKFVLPSGTYWTQFFNTSTGFKVKEEKKVVTKQGSFNQETFFYDYKTINGVKYPFRIKQSFGAQQLEFDVSSIKINSGLDNDIFIIK